MADSTRLAKALAGLREAFEPKVPVHIARVVGDAPSGDENYCEVDILRPDFSIGERREVIKGNMTVWPTVIVRVAEQRVKHGPGELAIVGVNGGSYAGSGYPPPDIETALHGGTHGFNRIDEINNLHYYQLYPLRIQPTDPISTSMTVVRGVYFAESAFRKLDTDTNVDYSGSWPSDGYYRYVTTTIDRDGNINLTDGSEVADPDLGDIPLPPSGEYLCGAVKIGSFMTALTRYQVVDLRHLNGITDINYTLVNELIAVAVANVMYQLDQHQIGGP